MLQIRLSMSVDRSDARFCDDLPVKNFDQKFLMFRLIQEFYIWVQNLNSICNKQK